MLWISSLFQVTIFITIKTTIWWLQLYLSIKEIFYFKNVTNFNGNRPKVKQKMYVSVLQRGGNMKSNTNVQINDPKSEIKVIRDKVIVCFTPTLSCLLQFIKIHTKNCRTRENYGT